MSFLFECMGRLLGLALCAAIVVGFWGGLGYLLVSFFVGVPYVTE